MLERCSSRGRNAGRERAVSASPKARRRAPPIRVGAGAELPRRVAPLHAAFCPIARYRRIGRAGVWAARKGRGLRSFQGQAFFLVATPRSGASFSLSMAFRASKKAPKSFRSSGTADGMSWLRR